MKRISFVKSFGFDSILNEIKNAIMNKDSRSLIIIIILNKNNWDNIEKKYIEK